MRDGLALFNYCFLGVGRGKDGRTADGQTNPSPSPLLCRRCASNLPPALPLSLARRRPQSLTVRFGVLQSIYVIGGEMDITL